MTVDLDNYSEKELIDLKAQVEKALSTLASRKRMQARKAAEEAALQHGYSLNELVGGKAEKPKNLPKYRNPEDPTQTWSGRGRQPGWIKQGLADGKQLSDFAI